MLGTGKCNDIKSKIVASIYYNKCGLSQNVLLYCFIFLKLPEDKKNKTN